MTASKKVRKIVSIVKYENGVRSLTFVNLTSTGATSVTVLGTGLGMVNDKTSTSRFGVSSSESTVWSSETQVQAKPGSGSFAGVSFEMSTSKQISTITVAITIDHGSRRIMFASNPSTGATSLTWSGSGHGMVVDKTSTSRFGLSSS